ncbi:hypothetical protein H7J86_24195 [Mycobacterium hackensackense]|uniref:hypothetical protein n=1 Tax=Mycobacterium hackensackense TaxID=228909 RepID=UPI002265E442|nr:hypothetical protein [Mycobacterium hackensackense]MCV7255268.1 hypothetical protein [Mycobacterium hackensackense]
MTTSQPMSADGFAWNETLTRDAIKSGRSMGVCEWHGDHPATDMHHRRNAGQGGKWHPANIFHICREIHHHVTVHPTWAHQVGLTLWEGESTARPVRLPSGLELVLTDELIAKAGVNAR